MRVLERAPDAGPRVALTFDDCNRDETWLEILRVLEAHDHAADGARVAEDHRGTA
jgi:peptidoglycan/xylan/chitin deacetylase (PgdA/CDA1 family)